MLAQTGREKGWKPKKKCRTREKLFVLPLLNLFPSDTSHQPLLSGWCLLVSPAARQSKALFLFSTHTSFYHFSTEFLGSLFKSSPFSFPFFFVLIIFVSLVFLWFFSHFFCRAAVVGAWLSQLFPGLLWGDVHSKRGSEGWGFILSFPCLKLNFWVSRKAKMFYGQGVTLSQTQSRTP